MNVSLEIVALGQDVYLNKRKAIKEQMKDCKDMVKLNAEAVSVWPEYEK